MEAEAYRVVVEQDDSSKTRISYKSRESTPAIDDGR
jgi:hypothetical protein